jgi:antitoxin ParD1/3/4
MAKVEQIKVELTRTLADSVHGAVASGDHANASEVVRDALRDWTMKRRVATMDVEELRRLYQEALDSAAEIDAETVFEELQARYATADKG